jgi:restriction system protein
MEAKLSPSKAVATKTIFEAFKILKEEGGQLPGKEVIDRIRERVLFTDWEKEIYEKTGYVRWEAILHFYTVDCIKAGYLRKSKGIWYLTPEGEAAMKMGAVELLTTASSLYRKWAAENKSKKGEEKPEEEIEANIEQIQKANLSQMEDQAIVTE